LLPKGPFFPVWLCDPPHGHGLLTATPGDRALLSAWLKQGRDFEAGFSRAEVHGVLTSRSPLKKSEIQTLEKSDL
jgi:hypothetical protein